MPTPEDLNLARRVVAQGVCQRGEVEECLTLQLRNEQQARASTLADLLVERGFVTRSQLARLTQSAPVTQQGESSTRLGPYELLLKLGEGGMGAVYRAKDTRTQETVAVKVLPRSKARDEVFLKRFEQEARAAFQLDHPNIVRGLDIGNSDGYHYLVMEFVEGRDVCTLLQQRGRLSETEALRILEPMAKALDHIHAAQLVHRDIKPENILIGENGIAKLADMGLTIPNAENSRGRRLTERGVAMGTPFYLSPEQIKGERDVDIRSDIYALGTTLYEMVTGRPPFDGETPAIVMMKHLNDQVPSPHDLDRTTTINFCHMLERMMAKDPADRYQTPFDLLQDARRVMRGKQPIGARPKVGGSSVARPELHQQSQRLEPVTARTPVIPDEVPDHIFSDELVAARERKKDVNGRASSGARAQLESSARTQVSRHPASLGWWLVFGLIVAVAGFCIWWVLNLK